MGWDLFILVLGLPHPIRTPLFVVWRHVAALCCAARRPRLLPIPATVLSCIPVHLCEP